MKGWEGDDLVSGSEGGAVLGRPSSLDNSLIITLSLTRWFSLPGVAHWLRFVTSAA